MSNDINEPREISLIVRRLCALKATQKIYDRTGRSGKLYGKCHDFKLPLMHCTLNQQPKPQAAFGQAVAAFAENKEAETTPQVP